ncbi:kinase [Escherichia phage vB_EcoP_EcoN5]|uniref:Kinase n=1 Tax=Escherichia phage vB_EcoP_EcoN5 TaxID=2686238 RepID=A0A7L4XTI2_9CAUD|nr:nucleotide kinase [Escherichia phage vB_EcoP_EcoN5]QGZ13829.1 kinase [Escherichia phage vB_EcoP_EcoN5]
MTELESKRAEVIVLTEKLKEKTRAVSMLSTVIDRYRKSIEEISSGSADTEIRYAVKRLTVKPLVGEEYPIYSSVPVVSFKSITEQTSQRSPALDVMIGGAHYDPDSKKIQPIEFYAANPQLNFQQCNMIKYAYRHKDKNKVQDLLKVVHYAMLECGFEYPEEYDNFRSEIRKLLGE